MNDTTLTIAFPGSDAWLEGPEGVTLVGGRCPKCAKLSFPRRSVCDKCGQIGEQEAAPLTRNASLYTYSEVHVAPAGFATPFVVGYVDLEEDVRILAQIEGSASDLAPDDPVEPTIGPIRELPDGSVVTSYRFRKVRA